MAETMSGASRNFGTGSYGNSSVVYQDPNNVVELSAEEIRAAYNEALREDQAHQDKLATQRNGDAWIEGHPEFVDNVPNAKLLLNQMNTMFGEGLHTISHFEAAYEYLRNNTDFLKLDAKELEKQRKASAKQHFENERARIEATRFDNNADYDSISLDEIRRRADEQVKQDMQKAGERGGNGF